MSALAWVQLPLDMEFCFIDNSLPEDFAAVHAILEMFGNASRLRTNIAKSVVYPISCDGINLSPMPSDFGAVHASLPRRNLGFLLGFRKLRRAELQPLLDKM